MKTTTRLLLAAGTACLTTHAMAADPYAPTTGKDSDTGSFNNTAKPVPDISSVLMYGKVETGFMTGNSDAGIRNTEMWNGTSYWGLRGTESLGGQTVAFFFLEQGFKLLSGKGPSNGVMWSKGSYVGLSNPFLGRIELGRMHKPDYWAYVDSDRNLDFSDSSLAAIKLQYDTVLGYDTYTDYFSNGVYYSTPHWRGLSADVAYGFSNIAGFQSLSGRQIGGRIRYATGPFKFNVAYNDYNYYTSVKTSDSSSWKTELISVSYKTWHDIEIGANYIHAHRTGDNWSASSWQVNAGIPVGPGDINIGTAHVSQSGERITQSYSVNYAYHLSRRTTLFADAIYYHNNRNGNAAVGVFANDTVQAGYSPWAVGVGIKHKF
ncbi:porin [Burkholderia sp. AU33545]|uniref:porin n=1 Tax=Burkholderia sp. AU33545 TaxID=2879631 RepID=UPI001CF33A0E|nr:porin [Burkholderia sp. AU33545]MCA8205107.1 porin [Burkholderia sp. AU33545]